MDEATGAAPTKRCARCRRGLVRACFTRGAWDQPGSYCRGCRTTYQQERRQALRNERILSPGELERLRRMVSCLVCQAVPQPIAGSRRVATDHHPDCPAAEYGTRKTG